MKIKSFSISMISMIFLVSPVLGFVKNQQEAIDLAEKSRVLLKQGGAQSLLRDSFQDTLSRKSMGFLVFSVSIFTGNKCTISYQEMPGEYKWDRSITLISRDEQYKYVGVHLNTLLSKYTHFMDQMMSEPKMVAIENAYAKCAEDFRMNINDLKKIVRDIAALYELDPNNYLSPILPQKEEQPVGPAVGEIKKE